MRWAAVVGCVLLLSVVGCSRQYYEERGKADAPVRGQAGENTAAEVYNFPDGFGNLATKCVGKGQRVYGTTKWVYQDDKRVVIVPSNAVIVADPGCAG
ncbi:hypothetical protein [Nocardia sp. NPDC052566]|uniref:hypothetical protein n=1 Tax=Nocardia sp. NPDC052566 TaxID=3364330 RepID=UPI0037CA79B4